MPTDTSSWFARAVARFRGPDVGATLARGATGSLVLRILGYALSFALIVVLARVLGPHEYGIYAVVLAWLNVMFLGGNLGFDNTVQRYVASYRVEENWSLLHGLWRTSQRTTTIASAIIAALAAGIVWLLGDRVSLQTRNAFFVACAALPFFVHSRIYQFALRGLLRVLEGQIPEFVLRPAVVILAVLALNTLDIEVTAIDAMACYLGATCISLAAGYYWLRKWMPSNVWATSPSYNTREWMTVTLPLFFLSGLYLVLGQTDTIMIGSMLGGEAAGVYTAANRIAMLILFSLTAVGAIAAPMISQLYAKREHARLQRLVKLSTIGISAVALVIAGGILVFGTVILGMFGSGFRAGNDAMRILVVANLVNAVAGPVGSLMTMTNHHKAAAYVMASAAALNVILNAIMIPRWGIEGAAIATTITTVLWNIALIVLVWRLLRIRASVLSLVRS